MIYLSAPYSSPHRSVRYLRYRAARRATTKLLMEGEVIFSPLVNSVPLLDDGAPNTWEFWKPLDYEYLKRCDGLYVLMLDGWEESVGVQQEIAWARELGMRIDYLEPEAKACA